MFLARAALLALGLCAAASPATAITTIATFGTSLSAANVRWQNVGANGQFYSIATSSATAPGAAAVDFSFLLPSIAPYVTNLPALFSLNATVTASPAAPLFGQLFQGDVTGTFAFTTTAPLVIGATSFAAGSNLLSGSFTQSLVYGPANGSIGTMLADTGGGSVITMTSDFLDFTGVGAYNINASLSALRPGLSASAGNALQTFIATANGAFASDVPQVIPIPEPQAWALMISGFAMVGVAARRRTRGAVLA